MLNLIHKLNGKKITPTKSLQNIYHRSSTNSQKVNTIMNID